MTVFDLQAILRLDKSQYEQGLQESEDQAESAGSKIGKALGALGKVVAGAAAAGAAAVGKLTFDTINSYGNYEQLIGGVETLFKDSADIVSAYADDAYKTAGISANEYMATVTSFSASLLQSLEGDTEAAARYADMAITDMSDNANKMGSDMSLIQSAYQGFAKQNYTMLDNLKLGYGGTKTEMERLIKDAERLDASFVAARDANGELAMSYADIVDAIHIVQTDIGITGTTAKEAATTIEGSVNSMKASWRNLVTALGNTNTSFESLTGLVDNFTDSIETAFGNILPVAENAIQSMADALPQLMRNLLPKISSAMTNLLPSLINTISGLVTSIGSSLPQITRGLVRLLPNLLQEIFSNIGAIAGQLLPSLAESLGNVLINLPTMLAGAVGGVVSGITNMVTGVVDAIKKQAESSIPDDIADGYVGKVKSNFEKSFSEGVTNIKLAVARLFGDTEWSTALENIKLAQDLQDKIVQDYESAIANISQYSFENFSIETEAKINTAMTLLGALKGQIDEEGNVTGSLEIVQSYIDQINSILGQDAVTLKETPADWLINIINKYKDKDGNVTEPEKVKRDIVDELNKLFGGDTINLNEQTYNAVSKVLSQYTEDQAFKDKDKIRDEIERMLIASGVDPVNAKIIADASVEEGALRTWFETSPSTSWSNSHFIEWMQRNGHLPTEENPAQVDAIAEVTTKYVLGEMDEGELRSALKELNLSDEDIEQIIKYTVDYSEVNDAIDAFKELTRQQYLSSLTKTFTDEQMTNIKNFTEAMDGAATSESALLDGMTGSELTAFNDNINAASMSLNAHKQLAKQMYEQYWELMGGVEGYASKEAFVQDMLEKDETYQNHSQVLQDLREKAANYAVEVVKLAEGYKNLRGEDKKVVDDILRSTDTWEHATDIMQVTDEQAESLKDALARLATDGYDLVPSSIAEWVRANTSTEESVMQLKGALEAVGGDTGKLSALLYLLSQNGDLTNEAISELIATLDESGSSTSEFADGMDDAIEKIGDAAQGAGDAAGEIQKAVSAKWNAMKLEATKVGTTLSTNITGEMLRGQPTMSATAGNFIAGGIEAMKTVLALRGTEVSDSVTDMESGMEEAISPVEQAMSDAGSNSGSNLDSSFGKWYVTVEKTVGKMYNLFQNVIGNHLVTDVLAWGSSIGENLYTGFSGWYSSIVTSARNIANGVKGAIEWLPSSLYVTMSYAGEGMYNGLSLWEGTIADKAWTIANNVNTATQRALDIKSPSAVLRRTMGFAGEGAFLGLQDWEDAIIGEAEGIAEGINNALQNDINTELSMDGIAPTIDTVVSTKSSMEQQILSLLLSYLPEIADRQVVLDSGETVGRLMPTINKKMGEYQSMINRGVVYA